MLYTSYSYSFTNPSGRLLIYFHPVMGFDINRKHQKNIRDSFRWSRVYISLRFHFCFHKSTQKPCLIFDVCIHPKSSVNHLAGKIVILGIRSLRRLGCPHYLCLTDPFSQLNQSIRELLKRSVRGQVLSYHITDYLTRHFS